VIFLHVQAGHVLHQGYIPEKCQTNLNCANKTQNSHLKQCTYWGLASSYIGYDYTTMHIWTCTVYTY